MYRRDALKILGTGLLLSSTWGASPVWAAKRDKRPLALLVPLTGPRAELGLSMRNAAMLGKISAGADSGELIVLDTGGTAQGAANAAREGLKRGAAIILGPVFSDEARAAAGVIGGAVPMICFTNDASVEQTGAHVFGITPGQSTTAVLRYARGRGIRNVLIVGDGTPWSDASRTAALAVQGELGIDVRTIDLREGQPQPTAGDAPDAVLIPGGSDSVLAAARNLSETGVQLLATLQGLDHRPAALSALNGAWLASIDPDNFGRFSGAYEARNGGNPGAIAALAYDATSIAEKLRAKNMLDRGGLLDPGGFDCVTGPVRFRTDGSCARQFAILVAGLDGYTKVAVSQGT